jgi:predicted HTH transcriptional regulator
MPVAEDDEEKNINDNVVRDAPETDNKDAEGQEKGHKKGIKGQEKGQENDAEGHKNGKKNKTIEDASEADNKDLNWQENWQEKGQDNWQEKGHKKGIKERENILGVIIGNPSVTIPSLADKFGLTIKETRTIINQMKAEGLIRRVGAKRGGHWEIVSQTRK